MLYLEPNELLVADLDLWLAANTPTTPFNKSENYDQHRYHDVISVAFDRNKPRHSMRRKIWEKGFTGPQLRFYEPAITSVVTEFLEKIASTAATTGKSIDISEYSLYVVCDIMGKVGLSKDFYAVKNARSDMIRLLTALFSPVGKAGRMQWPLNLLKGFNMMPKVVSEWEEWLVVETRDRVERGEKQELNDLMTQLVEEWKESPRTGKDTRLLEADTAAVLVGAT